MSSSSWMFGGDDGSSSTIREGDSGAKKTFFNREWNGDDEGGLQIGSEHKRGDARTALQVKRVNAQTYREQLDADKEVRDRAKQQVLEKDSAGMDQVVGDWQGRPKVSMPPPMQLSPSLIASKLSVASMIAQDSAPEKSPRYYNKQELDAAPDASAEFGIGESEDLVKRRVKAQKKEYLAALDRDTGNSRETISRAPRGARDHEAISTGVTGYQIGANAPTLDMSPSMKNLQFESKRRAQEDYRTMLSKQTTQKPSKAEALYAAASANATTDALPYMRY